MGICCSKNIVVPHGLDNAALIRNSPSTHSSRSVTPYKVEDEDVYSCNPYSYQTTRQIDED